MEGEAMNVNQLINMVVRMVMRKAINRGIDAGINRFAGDDKTAGQSKAQVRQARRAARMMRRR